MADNYALATDKQAPCDTSYKARRIEISLLTYLQTNDLMCITISTDKNSTIA